MAASRNTRQRSLVLQTVTQLHNHPAADEIFEAVSQFDTHISRATVYRNLHLLAERGEILRVRIPNGPDRFDFNIEAHYHLCCKSCGGVFDVDMPPLRHLERRIKNTNGFQLDGYEVIFSGQCPTCLEAVKKDCTC